MPASSIEWPADIRPESSPVFAHNELRIDADPAVLWAWLVRAAAWPEWYVGARRVRFESATGPDLALGTRFSWTTFGVRVDTTVTEWEPPLRLAWRGTGLGARGYHAWVLDPVGAGTLVVTEEAQAGTVPSVARFLLGPGLRWAHQRWLEGLARVGAQGARPDPGPPR